MLISGCRLRIRSSMKTIVTRRVVSAASGLGVCVLAATAARAQAPAEPNVPSEGVNVDVTECLELETREQQIACYLARVDEAVEASESNAAGDAATSQASGAPARAAQAEPSRRPTPARQAPQPAAPPASAARDAPAAEEVEDEEEEIVATITSLRELQPNTYVIDLDNGQVWRQSSPKRYFLRVGAEVHLVPTSWGVSYRLTDPNVGNFIQVERVR